MAVNSSTKKRRKLPWSRDDTELSLLALPTVIWYAMFTFMPMFGIIMAFKNYRIVDSERTFFYNLLASETT